VGRHYRQGLELREGRWCNRQELERLRREAEEDGVEAIERYLRQEQRCGTPLARNVPMVAEYIQRRAEKALPGGKAVLTHPGRKLMLPWRPKEQYFLAAQDSYTILVHSHSWDPPAIEISVAEVTPWQHPVTTPPSSEILVRSRPALRLHGDIRHETGRVRPATLRALDSWLNKQLNRLKRREK